MKKELIYLASPYTHENENVQKLRFELVCRATAILIQKGYFVFSPIAHTHPVAQYGLPKQFEYWKEYDHLMMSKCDKMIVLNIEGGGKSKGVAREIGMAVKLGMPIIHLTMWQISEFPKNKNFCEKEKTL